MTLKRGGQVKGNQNGDGWKNDYERKFKLKWNWN